MLVTLCISLSGPSRSANSIQISTAAATPLIERCLKYRAAYRILCLLSPYPSHFSGCGVVKFLNFSKRFLWVLGGNYRENWSMAYS